MKNKLQVDTRSCRTSAKHPQNKMNEKTPAQGRARTSGQISPNSCISKKMISVAVLPGVLINMQASMKGGFMGFSLLRS